MQPNELRSSLAFQAGDYLPIPVDQTELDYAVIGEHEAGELVAQRLEVFAEEVRGSLDFYRSQQDAVPLTRVVVSGGGSLLGPLVERLEAVTGLPVERGRTLAGVRVGRLGLDAEALAELGPTIAVPVGLAMRAVA
jgi:type IV pilus assembly protein PilM